MLADVLADPGAQVAYPVTWLVLAVPRSAAYTAFVLVPLIVGALGMSRLEAITAATKNGAIILAQEDLGTLEVGKLADLQVIGGNPLDSFDVLGDPELVMVRGRVLHQR